MTCRRPRLSLAHPHRVPDDPMAGWPDAAVDRLAAAVTGQHLADAAAGRPRVVHVDFLAVTGLAEGHLVQLRATGDADTLTVPDGFTVEGVYQPREIAP